MHGNLLKWVHLQADPVTFLPLSDEAKMNFQRKSSFGLLSGFVAEPAPL